MRRTILVFSILLMILVLLFCRKEKGESMKFTGAKDEVKLITVDPGHFHAALVQKIMYHQISDDVHVYAPEGEEVQDHLNRISGFNQRSDNPTHWKEIVYLGEDFMAKMVAENKGNVAIFSGNNKKKTEYLKTAVEAGFNVLADKPMCIDKNGFELLKQAFASAAKNKVLLYDIMTERYEITTILQRELVNMPEVFGTLQSGTADNPSVTKESVHHFFKYVAGNPIKRPSWYFDVSQQGEGLVDVTCHLVDLVQWECFPEKIINYETDVQMIRASHWPTLITAEMFEKVTRQPQFPDYLKDKVNAAGVLSVFCNGEMIYQINGIFTKVSVIWNFEAPAGGGDTHFSVMKGSQCRVVIKQGKEQNYQPELYVETPEIEKAESVAAALKQAIEKLQKNYPGISLEKYDDGWHIVIPDKYRVGHEAHFSQVTQKYLKFLVDGKLPDWETPNMIAKYFITTSALVLAQQQNIK